MFGLYRLIIIRPWTSAATRINFVQDNPTVLTLADLVSRNSGLCRPPSWILHQPNGIVQPHSKIFATINNWLFTLYLPKTRCYICTSRKGIEFKQVSFVISFRNWTNLLVSLRSHRQISGLTCAPKLNSTVNVLLLIMIANDCSTINPGPIQNPCGECGKAVKSNQRVIECEKCYVWFHKRCLGIDSVKFKIFKQHPSYVWICCNCGLPSFNSSLFLSNLQYTNRFAILSDSDEYANEESPLHTSSPLHSTPMRNIRKGKNNALMPHPQSNNRDFKHRRF